VPHAIVQASGLDDAGKARRSAVRNEVIARRAAQSS
jgi:hypothetical protein